MDVESIDRVITRIAEDLENLLFNDLEEAEHLCSRVCRLASKAFGSVSPFCTDVADISFTAYGADPKITWRGGTAKLRRLLNYMRDENALGVIAPILARVSAENKPDAKSVFLVHGHDIASRMMVENMLRKHGLKPVILDDQASEGATIIEKFEKHAHVRYAVAILSADDMGHAKDDPPARARARQNVLFELGYFFAKLGRSQVAALLTAEIEAPSDIQGVVWINLGRGDWEMRLLRELLAGGMPIEPIIA